MGTLNEKLEYLKETKDQIKEAIISKGQEVSSSDTFRSYASKISAIENGDVITVTNTTGSDVSVDDKVWVNSVVTYNFDVVGNPSIDATNKTVTGFSSSNHIALQTVFNPESNPWEMDVKFTTANDVSTTQYLFTSYNQTGYVLFIDQGHLYYGIKAFNMPGVTEIESNTTYSIKFGFDTSNGYYAKIKKEEDSEWTDDVTLSTTITLTGLTHSVFGVSPNEDSFDNPFLGTIDFSGTAIKVNNSDWWTPSIVESYSIINDTDITSTSFTAVAQTSIANNASGSVKTILDGNGSYAPTLGTKVITRNNTYSASTDDLYGYSSVTVNVEDIPAVVESLSITPTTSEQSFTPTSGVDGYSPVTVSAVDSTIDANITAGNIKSGVEILGVEGTYAGETPVLQDKVVIANGEYTADEGYDGIGTATVAVNATGATEIATNRTGAAINAGDKVWVNQEGIENKLVTFDNDMYNIASSDMYNIASLGRYFTPVTNNAKYLSISNTSISNFTSSLFTSSSNDFELIVKFFVNNASDHSRIFTLQSASTPGTSFFTWCSLSEDSDSLRKISLGFSYAQNAWDSINLNTEIEDNTWYCLMYSRSSGKLSLSLAKNSVDNVVETVTNPRDNVVFYCSTSYTYLSLAQTNSDYIPLTYDLSEVSFTSSYQNINWKALDLGNITEKTITGTAAESILAGATGNVYLGDKGALQSKVATSNGTVTPSEGYYGLSKVTVNVVGTGAEVEGKNYTGAVINEGDKVWINPYYYEAGTKFSIDNSMSGNYGAVLTPDGSKYIATNKLYNVSDNLNLGTFANTSSVSYSNEFRTFSNGEMYRTAGGYLQRCDSGLSWSRQNSYPIFGTSEYIYNSSTNAIERINPSDGSTIKSYGFSDSNASWLSYSNSFFAIFIDKDHILWPIGITNNNGNTCIVHLDDNNNAVVLGNNANINLCFHYISNPNRCCCMGVTSDRKYALVTTSSSSFNIYKLGDGSNITEIVNSDLKLDTSFLGNSYNCCAIYYTDKDILFNNKANSWSAIYSGTNLSNTKVYKYNPSTEEFKQVPVDFEGLFGGNGFGVSCVNGMIDIWYTQHSTGWKYVLTSEEKSGNNLVNYGSAVTSSTQTGTAAENITVGSIGTVKVGAKITPTGSITITENGTHDVTDYAEAIVNVTDVPAVVESLSITPSTSQQTFTPGTGVDGYAPVNVSAVDSTIDENIVAGNIKKDVTILGVTGTLEEGPQINNQNISVTTDGTYTADSGYTGLGTVTVTAGAVASAATQNEMAEELMLINDGATTFTLTVSPTDATPVITSTTNSVNITPTSSSDGTYVYDISMDSSKSYSYSVSKEGYVTSTGTINGGTASLTVTLVAES